jgi:hypothetical protein
MDRADEPVQADQERLPCGRFGGARGPPGDLDPVLDLVELVAHEPLGLRDRLAASEVGRDPSEVRASDLEVVSEHLVVADLEALDPGRPLLPPLQRLERLQGRAFVRRRTVDLGGEPGAEQAAGVIRRRWFLRHRDAQELLELGGGSELGREARQTSDGGKGGDLAPELSGPTQPVAERRQLRRSCPAARQTGRDPTEIADRP